MVTAVVFDLALTGEVFAQPEASIQGSGVVRVCQADGSLLDSDGDSYYRQGDVYLATPTTGFRTAFSCQGQTQSYNVFTTADPKGDERLGFRMVSQASISVTVEPEFTEVYGDSAITTPVCLVSDATNSPPVKLLVRARGTRSPGLPYDCMDDFGQALGAGACSGVRGRFQGYGGVGFVNAVGNVATPGTFVDLSAPDNQRWTKTAHLLPFGNIPGSYLIGSLSGTLITRVMHAPTGAAFGDLRIYVEVPPGVDRSDCPAPDAVRTRGDSVGPRAVLPRPAWFLAAGDAIPGDFTLAISPPTGPVTLSQQFDLSIVASTDGAGLAGISGTIDGVNVSGPLAACLQPTGLLHGVTGGILTCRGLSGGFLAGIFGVGAHALTVSLTLTDGRVITDTAIWTIRP